MASAFPTPVPSSSSTPPEPRKYSNEQLFMFEDLVAHLEQPDYVLPTMLKDLKTFAKARPIQRPVQPGSAKTISELAALKGVELRPLDDREKCFLSREQLFRFLRAVKWKFNDAVARTEETVVWRRDYDMENLTADLVEEEGRTGKEVILGFDNQCRPMQHMVHRGFSMVIAPFDINQQYPYRQNTKTSPRQIKYTVWYLERCIDLMGPGVENICLAIDFGADLGGKGSPTSPMQAKIVLKILQTYYCERLGRAICVNVPVAFWLFYKLLGPFIDPATREKIVFTRDSAEARNFVPAEQLEKSRFSGDLEFTYDHETFFPALDKLCKERREATFAAWQKLANGKVGYSEDLTRPALAAPS